jgi:hypothetical protein
MVGLFLGYPTAVFALTLPVGGEQEFFCSLIVLVAGALVVLSWGAHLRCVEQAGWPITAISAAVGILGIGQAVYIIQLNRPEFQLLSAMFATFLLLASNFWGAVTRVFRGTIQA